jgi:hypothetical protein
MKDVFIQIYFAVTQDRCAIKFIKHNGSISMSN